MAKPKCTKRHGTVSYPRAVTRQFLLDLADSIYNTLQNGPDPTCSARPMHCGLGELWFAMTGKQPNDAGGVTESMVVRKAVELSPFAELAREQVVRALRDLAAGQVRSTLGDALNASPRFDALHGFKKVLSEIPGVNDEVEESKEDDRGFVTSSYEDFRKRAQQVAAQLRKAAACLPA